MLMRKSEKREITERIEQPNQYARRLEHGYKRENSKEKNESLLIAAQNNAIRTNFIKVKIDNIFQNNKYRLCRERDVMLNPIISE